MRAGEGYEKRSPDDTRPNDLDQYKDMKYYKPQFNISQIAEHLNKLASEARDRNLEEENIQDWINE